MKLGFGLYRHHLTPTNYQFARQAGATHLVVHLVDYFRNKPESARADQPTGGADGWGHAGSVEEGVWSRDLLASLKRDINAEGLELHAIENLDPGIWHDILLDGPKRSEQIEHVKTIIRNMGSVGIPVLGYYFSLAGVAGRTRGRYARGNAVAVGMEGEIDTRPIPRGMVWNMVYDSDAPAGMLAPVAEEELWDRRRRFLEDVLPTAEECGVVLAAHPDDPPLPSIRSTPRLVHREANYDRFVQEPLSTSNKLEFCCGTLAEMPGCDLYGSLERHAAAGDIAYIHFRNVRGKAPNYKESFLDDGDIDMMRLIRILRDTGYGGVVIPDHAPQMECDAPWHAGMAWAMGYIKAAMDMTGKDRGHV